MNWVSVKDKLPTKDGRVLVYCLEGVLIVTYLADDYQGGFFVNPTKKHCEGITHWMPLPLPPKE